MPVGLEKAKINTLIYMLLVKKTFATLYYVEQNTELKNCLKRICSVVLNSDVIQEGVVNDKLYNLTFTGVLILSNEQLEVSSDKDEEANKASSRRKSDKSETEIDKSTSKMSISENTISFNKDDSFDDLLDPIKMKKPFIRIYLADSNGYLHFYTITDLFIKESEP